MFLARIDGTVTSTVKHETLAGLRLLIGQRLEADGSSSGDPLVLVDTLGARQGSTVMVTTDNEPLRKAVGDTTPARMLVCGIVDEVYRETGDHRRDAETPRKTSIGVRREGRDGDLPAGRAQSEPRITRGGVR